MEAAELEAAVWMAAVDGKGMAPSEATKSAVDYFVVSQSMAASVHGVSHVVRRQQHLTLFSDHIGGKLPWFASPGVFTLSIRFVRGARMQTLLRRGAFVERAGPRTVSCQFGSAHQERRA